MGAGSRHNIIGDQRTRPELRLRRVRDRIDRECANPLDVEALAHDAHMSARHLSRQFRLRPPGRKKLTGFAGLRPAGGKGDQTDQESRSSAAGPVPSIRLVQMGRFTHWRNCHE